MQKVNAWYVYEITKVEKNISALSIRCRVPQNLKIKVTLVLRDLIFQFY